MAFAQLNATGKACATFETCLSVHSSKLYQHGLPPAGPTIVTDKLAAAYGRRDWRIHAALPSAAQHPGKDAVRRRRTIGQDLTNSHLRPGLRRRERKMPVGLSNGRTSASPSAAVKMHSPLHLRGNIPSLINLSDGKLSQRSCPGSPLAGSRSHLRRGFRGDVDFARLYVLRQAGAFFVTHPLA